jgi:signal transduction histidine kinase
MADDTMTKRGVTARMRRALPAVVSRGVLEDARANEARLRADRDAALARAVAAEGELERHAGDLERATRDLEEVVSVASHDLASPLLTVSGFLTLLDERYGDDLDREANDYVAHALGGTRRMQRLIGDLLEYSRVGRAGLAPAEVDLGAVVRDALAALRGPIEEAGAEIVVDPLPAVVADPDQVARLVGHLVANAVAAAGATRPVVHVTARGTAEGCEVSVVDNGPGIDPADRDLVFKLLHRSATGRTDAGTGVGLAVARRIVERHGGRIWADPAPGGGTAFRFVLPAADALIASGPATLETDIEAAAA